VWEIDDKRTYLDLRRNKDQVASKHSVTCLFVICICILSTGMIKRQGKQLVWKRQEMNAKIILKL